MNASNIFSPVNECLMNSGKRQTNRQIAEDTGITERRVALLKKYPERATVAELEALTETYQFNILIGR